MAFRATNIIPQEGFNKARSLAVSLRRYASGKSATWASGTDSEDILDTLKTLIGYSNNLNAIKEIPGIGEYAKSVAAENDPTYEIGAEFTAMVAAIDAVVANIIATFPDDANGFLLAESLDASGAVVQRQFSGAALASIRADLDAIAASIS